MELLEEQRTTERATWSDGTSEQAVAAAVAAAVAVAAADGRFIFLAAPDLSLELRACADLSSGPPERTVAAASTQLYSFLRPSSPLLLPIFGGKFALLKSEGSNARGAEEESSCLLLGKSSVS